MPSTRRASKPEEVHLANAERQFWDIVAIDRQDIEGVELDLVIVLPRVQAVEVAAAINAEQHGLAIDQKRTVAVPERGLGDPRKSAALPDHSRSRLPSRWMKSR